MMIFLTKLFFCRGFWPRLKQGADSGKEGAGSRPDGERQGVGPAGIGSAEKAAFAPENRLGAAHGFGGFERVAPLLQKGPSILADAGLQVQDIGIPLMMDARR